jgi:hypothetical protein
MKASPLPQMGAAVRGYYRLAARRLAGRAPWPLRLRRLCAGRSSALRSPAEILAGAANPYHAAHTRSVSAAWLQKCSRHSREVARRCGVSCNGVSQLTAARSTGISWPAALGPKRHRFRRRFLPLFGELCPNWKGFIAPIGKASELGQVPAGLKPGNDLTFDNIAAGDLIGFGALICSTQASMI